MFNRITVNPNQMSGEPCIRSLRIPVATIVTLFAQGLSVSEIISYYPDLVKEDIEEALNFAAETVREKELPLLKVG
ncbi:MAG: DUF433 domain-containing protein [Cytophagales bacterium]|jgi:uncharacterized protein (DUF433 family)|nr:DUF433 domain-containing protein [Cytophagales bacterium]MCA6369360.1 DUF433 domain-containing protein [Cytophagales bacterium]MCA6373985.1 DUF433 domain-containing protein [Cytophagales bacterium]MCA6376338.1 DUF433 domain-containing protein [Cytophagales bacterium]MCA6385553.1 DUF433 domain-containing protein [Cytophagales bacterium]